MNHAYQNQSPWFWWDNHGDEIDLLFDTGLSLDIFETKASETLMTENIKGLVYAGKSNQNRLQGKVISWRDFPIPSKDN